MTARGAPARVGLTLAVLAGCHAEALRGSPRAKDRLALSRSLPALDGAHLEVKVVEVTYDPGASSSPHRHPCPVIGYVVEGALRMQLKGQAEVVYGAGDTFYERPDDIHLVSANASSERPATFIAVFTCDHDGPLSVAAPEAHDTRRR